MYDRDDDSINLRLSSGLGQWRDGGTPTHYSSVIGMFEYQTHKFCVERRKSRVYTYHSVRTLSVKSHEWPMLHLLPYPKPTWLPKRVTIAIIFSSDVLRRSKLWFGEKPS